MKSLFRFQLFSAQKQCTDTLTATQFVIFKPLSYWFEETIGFDVNT